LPIPELVYWTHSGHLVFHDRARRLLSFLGPSSAALALTLLQTSCSRSRNTGAFVLGAVLAAMVIFFPRGLAGIAGDITAWIGRRKGEAGA
jgi:branched-chain amino acid transport system permease protein